MAQPGTYSTVDNPVVLGYGKNKFVEPFVTGAKGRMASSLEEILANTTLPMAVSGVTKRVIPNQAKQHGLDWYYVDTGYFGNGEYKKYFRITKNGRHATGPIIARSDARLKRIKLDRTRYVRGKKILLVPPDEKACETYQLIPPEQWIQQTVDQIRSFTDRPIEIRQRPGSRFVRTTSDRFVDALRRDINAVVVWSSNCGVESAMHGIPVVVLGECGAQPLSGKLEDIDNLQDLDENQIELWLRHLSYCQFTIAEMKTGLAWQTVAMDR